MRTAEVHAVSLENVCEAKRPARLTETSRLRRRPSVLSDPPNGATGCRRCEWV